MTTVIQCNACCTNNDDGICTKQTVRQGFFHGEFSCGSYEDPDEKRRRDEWVASYREEAK